MTNVNQKTGIADPSPSVPLAVRDLKLIVLLSLLIAILTAVVSIASLLNQDTIYPTEELRQMFIANDVVNLFVGLPILLGSMWLAQRGRLTGLLFWPGALFYGLYNYLVYLFGMPFNVMFPFYLAIVTLSIYTTIGLVASIDGRAVKKQLTGNVPERLAGGILLAFGILFMLLALSQIVGALADQATLPRSELALQTADVIISAALVTGGALLWRKQALGYVGGTGLLFLASMLFVGLMAILILQPLVSDAPLAMVDILTILVMSLICLIPFGLFLRGVNRS